MRTHVGDGAGSSHHYVEDVIVGSCQSGSREARLCQRRSVIYLRGVLGGDGHLLRSHGQGTKRRIDAVVVSLRPFVQRVGERVGAAAHVGLRAGHGGRVALAGNEAVARQGNRAVGQRSSIIDLRIRSGCQGDVTAGHRQGVSAVCGVVVGVACAYVHIQRAHVRDARHSLAPIGGSGLVLDLDHVAGHNAGSLCGRIQGTTVVHLGDVLRSRTCQMQAVGRSLRHGQSAVDSVDAVVVSLRAIVQRVGERIGAAAHDGLRTGHVGRVALAADEAVARQGHRAVGQRSAVVHLRIRSGCQGDVAAGHRQVVLAVCGVIVGVGSTYIHMLLAHVRDAGSGGAPLRAVGAVFDLDLIVSQDTRSGSGRLQSNAIVHLRDIRARRTGQVQTVGRSLGHLQGTIHIGNGVAGGDIRACSVLDLSVARDVSALANHRLATGIGPGGQDIGADQGGGGSVAVRQGSTVIHLLIAGSGHRQGHRRDSQGTLGSDDGATVVAHILQRVGINIVIRSILAHIGNTVEGRGDGQGVASVQDELETIGAGHRLDVIVTEDNRVGIVGMGSTIIRPAVVGAGDGDVLQILRHRQGTVQVIDRVVEGHFLVIGIAYNDRLGR